MRYALKIYPVISLFHFTKPMVTVKSNFHLQTAFLFQCYWIILQILAVGKMAAYLILPALRELLDSKSPNFCIGRADSIN